jgi:hypothetical protein
MGPKLARSLVIVVGAVAVLGSARPGSAQSFPELLGVRMPDDAHDVDVKAVAAIAARLGIPFGFEEAGALTERVSAPFLVHAHAKPLVSVRPRPLDVRGVTLRQALDAVVSADRRYEWRDAGGVIVVRPVASWGDPSHPLLRPAAHLRQRNRHLEEALAARPTGSLFDTLNDAARVGSLHWSLTSSSGIVFLDRGRAVEVFEPMLSLSGEAGDETISLSFTSVQDPTPR